MTRILVADSLDRSGLEILKAAGAEVVQLAEADRSRLKEIVGEYDALLVRSATKVTAEVLAAGKRLKVVGRAGIGVDNVDVEAATALGILVVNAPTANLVSATEQTWALLLAVARRIPEADSSTKAGGWDRKLTGVELYQKTLGVIGFGRIGQRVAARAKGFEMNVVAHDPHLDAEAARRFEVEVLSLDDLLRRSHVVTLHTPLTPQTRNLLDASRLSLLPAGALVINCGRGGVIDEEALLAALEAGAVGGAGLDVFAEEPPKDRRLVNHSRVVASPHLGAQTREAQERTSTETAHMVLAALSGSVAVPAVNLPFRPVPGEWLVPVMELAQSLGRLSSLLLGSAPERLDLQAAGCQDEALGPIAIAALTGILPHHVEEAVNLVNAERIAKAHGLEVVRAASPALPDAGRSLTLRLSGAGKELEVGGAVTDGEPRLRRFGVHHLDVRLADHLLFVEHRDLSEADDAVGAALSSSGVEIAESSRSQREGEGPALTVLRIPVALSDEALSHLLAHPDILSVHAIALGATKPGAPRGGN
jgi:D-3-phosphoglycerate dehydrogenase